MVVSCYDIECSSLCSLEKFLDLSKVHSPTARSYVVTYFLHYIDIVVQFVFRSSWIGVCNVTMHHTGIWVDLDVSHVHEVA